MGSSQRRQGSDRLDARQGIVAAVLLVNSMLFTAALVHLVWSDPSSDATVTGVEGLSLPSASPPKSTTVERYFDSFDELQGMWIGQDHLMVGAGGFTINGTEIDCHLELSKGRPLESYNVSGRRGGVWWVGHCTGTRFAPGPTSVVRTAAYRRISDGAEQVYVVVGDFQYGPFRRAYTD